MASALGDMERVVQRTPAAALTLGSDIQDLAFSFAAEPGPYCKSCMGDTLEEASLGVCFPRATWPLGDLDALINELPPLSPEIHDDEDDGL